MMKLVPAVLALLLLLALANRVRPQCITDNDTFTLPGTPDLSGIAPFSVGLFSHLYPPGSRGNFFFSPFSIWNALGLAYLGSAGNTEAELRIALQVDKINALALLKALVRFYAERQTQSSGDYTIDLANRVYVDLKFTLPECVTEILHKEVENINFEEGDGAAATINGFVKDVTRNKIPKLVKSSDVQGATMVLVNAAYFKGLWTNSFLPNATRKERFYTTPTQYTMVDMMHQKATFNYGESVEIGAQVLEMPYKGEAASMFVFLPHETADYTIDPMEAMLQRLTPDGLRRAISSLYSTEVIVQIPKFKLEQTISDKLKEALQCLEVQQAFSRDANFSVYDPTCRIWVKSSLHKAVVEVNEGGTEAAAVTLFQLIDLSLRLPMEFICNRPFLFVIYDSHFNSILFMGVYRQPQEVLSKCCSH